MQEWEKVYIKYIKLKLPKVNSNRSIKNFIFTIKSISLGWLEYWKNKLQNYKQGKKKLSTVFKLVKIY